ncbi:RmlC-like cupin family protein [Cavenderia fasciculata]|uniref:RmlC-like cupin family protein n=1 Tax=Cavenderia fasciculata TaxID=261658 RepID=F4PZX1_CACFS|nr:RmlC-like cupin family protein [Cavenderia fasciculata]EGG18885.1 RmlC-like cupin family protein [Cavenderia fasciculata]|eukprot:XP_004357347.1 RmlC-like cupin family protein [Cavenderia fasciculata]
MSNKDNSTTPSSINRTPSKRRSAASAANAILSLNQSPAPSPSSKTMTFQPPSSSTGTQPFSPRTSSNTIIGSASSPAAPLDEREHPLLGPMWTLHEVTDFWHIVKKQKPSDWNSVIKKFPNRTCDMLESMYNLTSSIIPECRGPDNFQFMVKGIFLSGATTGSSSNQPPPSSNTNGGGGGGGITRSVSKTRRGQQNLQQQSSYTQPPLPTFNEDIVNSTTESSQPPPPSHSTRPTTKSKARRLFTDPPASSINQPDTSTSTTTTTTSTPQSLTKKRKAKEMQASPLPSPSLSPPLSSSPSSLPAKLRSKSKYSSPTSDTISGANSHPSPSSPRPTFVPTQQTQLSIQKRLTNFLTSHPKASNPPTDPSCTLSPHQNLRLSGKWALCEWFYSDIDAPFFFYNEFQMWLNQNGIGSIKKLSRMEWNQVRSRMKKPRRLSQRFFEEAREKLYQTRDKIRQSMLTNDLFKFIQIEPDSKVLYIKDNSLLSGIIISYIEPSQTYTIKNDVSNQIDYISDIHVMSIDKNIKSIIENNFLAQSSNQTLQQPILNHHNHNNNNNNDMNGGGDYNQQYSQTMDDGTMVVGDEDMNGMQQGGGGGGQMNLILVLGLIVVLEKKEALIGQIERMNDQAQDSFMVGDYPQSFRREYSKNDMNLNHNYPQQIATIQQAHQFSVDSLMTLAKDKSKEYVDQVALSSMDLKENHVNFHDIHSNVKDTIYGSVILMTLLKQSCTNSNLSSQDISTLLDISLQYIKPKATENLEIFNQIQESIQILKQKILIDQQSRLSAAAADSSAPTTLSLMDTNE